MANRDGILEYDGENWTLIQSPEQEVARSLAKDDNGVIYAGFVGNIGYLRPNEILIDFDGFIEPIKRGIWCFGFDFFKRFFR